MATIKNVTDKVISGIVGVGTMQPDEIRIVGDPVDHPGLQTVKDDSPTTLTGTELPTATTTGPATPLNPPLPTTPAAPASPPSNVTNQGA